MSQQFLFDIGNSFVKVFERSASLSAVNRLSHQDFLKFLDVQKVRHKSIELLGVSVVPSLDNKLLDLLGSAIHILNCKEIPLLNFSKVKDVNALGMDRLVSLFEVYRSTRQASCVIDSGTATTITLVDDNGSYQGGCILPGFEMTLKALNYYTEKIPLVTFKQPSYLLSVDTDETICSGIYYGFSNMINGLIQDIKKHYPNCRVIGCGSGLNYIKGRLNLDSYDDLLLCKGLQTLADLYLN